MRVWHLTKSLSGGAGQYALRLSTALRATGVDSKTLVVEGAVVAGASVLHRVDSPLRLFAARCVRSFSHRVALGPFHSLTGFELYESPQPIQASDIVHLHGMTGWIGVAGLRRLIPPGAKVFWTAHDLWMLSGGCVVYRGCDQFQTDCSRCPILRSPWSRLAQHELRLKREFIAAHNVKPIANSQWMANRIRESCLFREVDSIPIIPPIVAANYLAEDIPDLRGELGIPLGRKVISLGARALDDKYKGIPEFLAQLSRTPELAGQLTVLLFGPGKIQIPTNLDVRLLGNVNDPSQLAKVYRTSDVYVSPSSMETFGMTLSEAQAVGTRVAAFDVGGVRDAVHPEARTQLASIHHPDRLLAVLAEMLAQETAVNGARSLLRTWARMQFSAEHLARKQKLIYTQTR